MDHNLRNPIVLTLIFLVIVGAGLLFAAAYYFHFYGKDGQFSDSPAAAEAVVREFGTHMKNVPLLAPAENVGKDMDTEYGPFVLPDTLAAWKKDPQNAPGRLTSSPWPDHIEIATTTKTDSGYRVEGVVVELTSDTAMNGGQGTSYPVAFTLVRRDNMWKISGYEHETTPTAATVPATTSLTGTYVCLPHKDQSGPQTMECAFGLQTDDGTYYALDFSSFTSDRGLTLATGERIKAGGSITPLAQIPTGDHLRIYAIEGVVHVTTLTAL